MEDEEKIEDEKVNEQATLQSRIDVFVKEYGELVNKHKIDFATYPMFVPDATGGFKIIVQNQAVDMTNKSVRSPFIA